MSESQSERLDAAKLGEEVGDDELPSDEYPKETAMAVDDPTIVRGGVIARDDVATRDARQVDDDRQEPAAPGLVETTDDPAVDDEAQLLADEVDAEESPEADAVHITDE